MKIIQSYVYFLILGFTGASLFGHCQVPCGIYDDASRVQQMLEDVSTISKAIDEIHVLNDKNDVQSNQQLIRWVNNKEIHADKIIDTISNYFLTQRVKPSAEDYLQRLSDHHAVILLSMKAKQKADEKIAEALKEAVEALSKYYHSH
ncbi:MAG: superoxide dismutase [Ni] [Opitutales bacterium]|jgi:nickel superoxide dismutase